MRFATNHLRFLTATSIAVIVTSSAVALAQDAGADAGTETTCDDPFGACNADADCCSGYACDDGVCANALGDDTGGGCQVASTAPGSEGLAMLGAIAWVAHAAWRRRSQR